MRDSVNSEQLAVKERPILFSTEMVQAILDGRKTETRRAVTSANTVGFTLKKELMDFTRIFANNPFGVKVKHKRDGSVNSDTLWRGQCKWQEGDLLYVRETWARGCKEADPYCHCDTKELQKENHFYVYKADTPDAKYPLDWDDALADDWNKDADFVPRWKPSIHMPKEASRIWLRVKEVKVERVQDITYKGIVREGISFQKRPVFAAVEFEKLWNSINKSRGYGWNKNPWVWVVKFEVVSTDGRPG